MEEIYRRPLFRRIQTAILRRSFFCILTIYTASAIDEGVCDDNTTAQGNI
jgi:hypothetical protein